MANEISRFEQDFESGAANWFGGTSVGTVEDSNAPSGAHVLKIVGTANTNFGSYSSEFAGGYTTRISFYIDPNALVAGQGFNWDVASSTQNSHLPTASGGFLRDFIFHVAKDADTGTVLINASNNGGATPQTNLDVMAGSATITDAGWYTFEHTFRDNGGKLSVDFTVFKGEDVVFTKTIDTNDDIATQVGGNRYGWVQNNTMPGGILYADNLSLHENEGYGTTAADNIVGSDADEAFYTSAGNDVIDGGDGIDTYDASGAAEGVTVDLDSNPFAGLVQGEGFAVGGPSVGIDGLSSIENVRGSDFNDIINGSGSDNVFYASAGTDIVDGAAGTDTFDASDAIGSVTINLAGQTASGFGGTSTVKNVENAVGGSGNDFITGTNTPVGNELHGNAGNDTFYATTGADTIDGGADSDTVVFTGSYDDYDVTWNGATAVVTDGLGNVTTITNAGTLQFAGGQKVLLVGAKSDFTSIQAGVNAAANGDIVLVAAGTYSETVNVTDRAITIEGVGTVNVNGGFVVSDVMEGSDVLRFANLNINASGNAYGINVRSSAIDNAGTVELDGVDISNAKEIGLFYAHPSNGSNPLNPATIGAFVIEGSDFANNGQVHTGAKGQGHINLFGFNGDLTINGGTFSSPTSGLGMPIFPNNHGIPVTAAGTPVYAHKAITVTGIRTGVAGEGGYAEGGSFSLTGVVVQGNYGSDAVSIYHIQGFETAPVLNIDFVDVSAPWGLVNIDSVGGTVDFSQITGSNASGPITTPQGLGTNDVFTGTDGTDMFNGRGGDDVLTGNGGNDVFVGGAGSDSMYGGDGNDIFVYNGAGEANDTIVDGGADTDGVLFNAAAPGETLNIGPEFSNIESVSISSSSGAANVDASLYTQNGLNLIGNSSANEITGTNQVDNFVGVIGDDILSGLDGDDSFSVFAGQGAAQIDGGDGQDTVLYAGGSGVPQWTPTGWVVDGDTLDNVEIVSIGGTVYHLVGNGGFASINDAIAAAEAGDVILVGDYFSAEDLVIDRGISIIGQGMVLVASITFTDVAGADVSLDNINVDGGHGVVVDAGDNIGTLTITGGSISGAANGLAVFGDNVGNIVMNGTALSGSAGHLVKLYDYTGDASFTDVTATGSGAQGAFELIGTPNTDLGSSSPIGEVSFDNVTVDGSFTKSPVGIYNYADTDALEVNDLDLSDAGSSWPAFNIDGIAGDVDASSFTIDAGNGVIALQGNKAGQPGDGSNAIEGTANADTIIGKGGDDTLDGNDGDDTFVGGDGSAAGAGNDTMIGGEGLDTVEYGEILDVAAFKVVDGKWQLETSADGTDGLQLEIVEHAGGRYLLVGGEGGYASLQDAIDDATQPGDVILVTGTHHESVVISTDGLQIVGMEGAKLVGTFRSDNANVGQTDEAKRLDAGESITEFLSETNAYSGNSGAGIRIAANDVTIKNLAITEFLHAVRLSTGTDLYNEPAGYENISGITLENLDLSSSVMGIHKSGYQLVDGLTVLGGKISDIYIGMDLPLSSATRDREVFDLTVDGTVFENVLQKGIYIETARGETKLINLDMDNVGQFGGGAAFGAKGLNGAGIDFNLKYATYGNTDVITIDGFDFDGVGLSNGLGTSHANAAAIAVKGRDDAPSYDDADAADVAALTINITNGSIDGSSTGIRLGEYNKVVSGPDLNVTNVTVDGVIAQVENITNSTLTIHSVDGQDITASANTTGSIVFMGDDGENTFTGGAGNDTFVGGAGNDALNGGAGIDSVGYTAPVTITFADGKFEIDAGADGTDTLSGIEVVTQGDNEPVVLLVGAGGYATINDALVAAGGIGGDIVIMLAPSEDSYGTVTYYNSSLTSLTIKSAVPGGATVDTVSIGNVDFTLDGVDVYATQTNANFLDGNWTAVGFYGPGKSVTVKNAEITVDTGSASSADAPQAFGFVAGYNTGNIVLDNVDIVDFVGAALQSSPNNSYGVWINGSLSNANTISITNSEFDLGLPKSVGINLDSQVGGDQVVITDNTFGEIGDAPGAIRVTNWGPAVTSDIVYSKIDGNTFADDAGDTGLMINATGSAGATKGFTVTFGGGTYASAVEVDTVIDASSAQTGKVLNGTAGVDILVGSAFNDTLSGGAGADIINGNGGIDTVEYTGAASVALVGGEWVVTSTEGPDTLSNVEIINDSAAGRVLLVGAGGFASLAAAVAAAQANDTILLADGDIGGGDVVIGSGLTGLKIYGVNKGVSAKSVDPSIDAGSTFSGRLHIQADGVEINGVRFVDGLAGGALDKSSIAVTGDNVVIRNSVFYRDDANLQAGFRAIYTPVGAGNGDGLTVEDSSFTGWSTGLYLNGANGASATDNNFTGNFVGMSLDTYGTLTTATIEDNVFDNAFENVGIGASLPTVNASQLIGENEFLEDFSEGYVNHVAIYALAGSPQTLIGTDNDDVIEGNAQAQTVTGGKGNDWIQLGDGADTVNYTLGDGNDTITDGGGTDQLNINAASATAASLVNISNGSVDIDGATINIDGVENVSLTLGAGLYDDVVDASGFTAGKLNLTLGGGNDRYVAASGNGHIVNAGANGSDTVDFSGFATAVSVQLGSVAANNMTSGGAQQTLTGFENVKGSAYSDVLYGTTGANTFFATLGDDIINGMGGIDTYDASGLGAAATIDLSGFAFSTLFTTQQTLLNIRNAVGTDYADTISGTSNANELRGGKGDDMLIGNGGADKLFGGAGYDRAVFTGNRSEYTIGKTSITNAQNVTTQLDSIEELVFDDGTLQYQDNVDINGNKTADIVTISDAGALYYRDGGAPTAAIAIGNKAANSTIIGSGDFNGDGLTDFVLRTNTGFIYYGGTTNGNLNNQGSASLLGVGDFNGDGKDDMLFKNSSDFVYYYNGAQASGYNAVGTVSDRQLVGIGDFNGDGKDDLLFKNSSDWYSTLEGASVRKEIGARSGQELVAIADLDGDGKDEIVFQNAGDWVSYTKGTSSVNIGFRTGEDVVGVGDFNGDGKDDLLFQRTDGRLAFLSGATNVVLGTYAGSSVIGVDDYNGDGRDDVLVRDNGGNVSYLSVNGSVQTTAVGNFGADNLLTGNTGTGIQLDMTGLGSTYADDLLLG